MGLTQQHIHVWEHAALLYQGYEWQSSIDAFLSLSKGLKHDTTFRVRCLLNAGMIQARLGDYNESIQTLELAASIDDTCALTPFLLGIVEWELGNAIKSEASFRLCLQHAKSQDIDYLIQGLDYVLETDIVLNNINLTQYKYVKRRATLLAVPAECIFEAPYRTLSTASTPVPIVDHKGFKRAGRTPDQYRQTKRQTHGRILSGNITPEPPVHSSLQVPTLRPATEPVSPPKPVSISRIAYKYRNMLSQPSAQSSNKVNPHNAWCQRPRRPYVARDARGEREFLSSLANFIRNHNHREELHVPKGAKGEWGTKITVPEMQTFVRFAGTRVPHRRSVILYGERTRPSDKIQTDKSLTNRDYSASVNDVELSLKPEFSLDVVPPSPSTTNIGRDEDDEYDKSSPSAAKSVRLPSRQSPLYFDRVRPPQENQLLPKQNEASPDFLLPATVYNPKANVIIKPFQKDPSPPMDLIVTPPQFAQPWNYYRNLHTAGSETSSLFAASITTTQRRRRATDAAMRMLEGRPRSLKPPRIPQTHSFRAQSPLNTTRKTNLKRNVGKIVLARALKRKYPVIKERQEQKADRDHELRREPLIGSDQGLRGGIADVKSVGAKVDGGTKFGGGMKVEDDDDRWPRSTVSSTSFFGYLASGNG